LKRVKVKLKEIGVDDFFWATVTPSQAAIMMLGHAPPTPKELVGVMKEVFVKDKMLEKKYVDDLEHILKVRKSIEHGDKQDVSGEDIDDLYSRAERFVTRLNKLFEQIQESKNKEVVVHTYENAVTLVRDALQAHGHNVKDADLLQTFESELVEAGHIPQKFVRILNDIADAKKKFDNDDLSPAQALQVQKDGREFFRYVLEFLQRKRGGELAQATIRIKHQEKIGELLFIDDDVFVTMDVAAEDKEYQKLTKTKKGWSAPKDVSEEEYEQAVSEAKPQQITVTANLFGLITDVFGPDAEVLL
jgi:uncharacterized protein (UPF0332 family)